MTSPTVAPGQPGPRLNAALYADSVAAFLRASDDEVYAPLRGLARVPQEQVPVPVGSQLPVLRAALDRRGPCRLPEFGGPTIGFCLFALEPLRIAFANVLHEALEAAVLFEQLPTDFMHFRDDRIVGIVIQWFLFHASRATSSQCAAVASRSRASDGKWPPAMKSARS